MTYLLKIHGRQQTKCYSVGSFLWQTIRTCYFVSWGSFSLSTKSAAIRKMVSARNQQVGGWVSSYTGVIHRSRSDFVPPSCAVKRIRYACHIARAVLVINPQENLLVNFGSRGQVCIIGPRARINHSGKFMLRLVLFVLVLPTLPRDNTSIVSHATLSCAFVGTLGPWLLAPLIRVLSRNPSLQISC